MNDELQDTQQSEQRIRSFFDALRKLSDDQRKALRLCAHKLLSGTRYDSPDDLLHEAIYRAGNDSRQWRESMDPAVFLFHTMRSIASVDRRNSPKVLSYGRRHVSFEDWAMEDQIAAQNHENLSPEAILILREQITEIESIRAQTVEHLSTDPEALAIFEARFDDTPPREIKASLGLDDRTFKAADERARQALRRAQRRPRA